jgi:hypothetical protein
MDAPTACTLGNEAMGQRVEEWRTALAESVTSTRRPSSNRLLFTLRDDVPPVELLRLSVLEKRCCPFLTLEFEVTTDGVVMAIGAPIDATPVLDEFASLVEDEQGGREL